MNQEQLLQLRGEIQNFIKLFGVLNQNVTPCGFQLSLSQVFALQELEKEVLTVNDLSKRLLLERSSVSRLVDALVKSGFIVREQNEKNRREVLLHLTPKGYKSVEKIREQSIHFLEKVLANVSNQEQEMVYNGLRILTNALEDEKERSTKN